MTLKEQIIQHRHGIMGTVIFHLLLAIVLLSVEISRMQVHSELEIAFELPEPEEERQQQEEQQRREEIRRQAADEEVERLLRSIAVNENVARNAPATPDARVEGYIDEILDDLRADGSRYRAQRDEHYCADSLRADSDRREQELDSLRSTFYAGESSVSYNLKDRYARRLPIPVFKCENGGKVVVAIQVTPRGTVRDATVVPSLSAPDEALRRVARDAALRSLFNEKEDAPSPQQGTITYNFVKQ